MCRAEEATDTPLDYYMICMVCEEQTLAERESCPICKGKGKIDWEQLCDEFALQADLSNQVIALQKENRKLKRQLKALAPVNRKAVKPRRGRGFGSPERRRRSKRTTASLHA